MSVARYLLVGIVSLFLQAVSFAKEIALTFDDAPRASTQLFEGSARASKLLRALSAARVSQTAFFVNSARLDTEGLQRVGRYAAAGHLLANHTHSHPNVNAVSADDFIDDMQRAHNLLLPLRGFWSAFRFPYLREGDTVEKRDRIREALRSMGYLNAYITVNNYDWEMDRLLQQALREGRSVDYDRLREVYLEVLLACVDHYDRMARELLSHSPRHILLLHENDINALFVGDLVEELRRRNWEIVSPLAAYDDPIAARESNSIFRYNPGRIGEIARDSGRRGDLWHESCDEEYLARLFAERGVFSGAEEMKER